MCWIYWPSVVRPSTGSSQTVVSTLDRPRSSKLFCDEPTIEQLPKLFENLSVRPAAGRGDRDADERSVGQLDSLGRSMTEVNLLSIRLYR